MFIKKFSKLFVLALIVTSAFSLSDSNVEASGSWSSYGRLAYVSFDESSTPDRDIVVWDADPLEPSSFPQLVFIEGKSQDLISRSTRLTERYTNKDKKPSSYKH